MVVNIEWICAANPNHEPKDHLALPPRIDKNKLGAICMLGNLAVERKEIIGRKFSDFVAHSALDAFRPNQHAARESGTNKI
jgi:hypothetical protein